MLGNIRICLGKFFKLKNHFYTLRSSKNVKNSVILLSHKYKNPNEKITSH